MALYTKIQNIDLVQENTIHYLKTNDYVNTNGNNQINSYSPKIYTIQAVEDHLTSTLNANVLEIRNINDSISLMQTAESALDKIIKHLQDIRDITLKALQQVLPINEQELMQHKVNQLVTDIHKIAKLTEFNGHSLFKSGNLTLLSSLAQSSNDNESISKVSIFNGTALDDYLTMLESIKLVDNQASATNTPVSGDVSNNAYVMISEIDKTLKALSHEQSQFKNMQTHFEHKLNQLQTHSNHITEYRAKINSMSEAEKNTHFTYDQILDHVPSAILAQANNSQHAVANLLSSY